MIVVWFFFHFHLHTLTLIHGPSLYRPNIADQHKVGFFTLDRCSQTEVTEVVDLKEMTEVLQILLQVIPVSSTTRLSVLINICLHNLSSTTSVLNNHCMSYTGNYKHPFLSTISFLLHVYLYIWHQQQSSHNYTTWRPVSTYLVRE